MIDRSTKHILAEWVIAFAFALVLCFCFQSCNSAGAVMPGQQIIPLSPVLEKALSDALGAPSNSTPALIIGGDTNGGCIFPVTLAWDQSPDTNVIGNNVYFGVASRTYTNVFSVGMATNCPLMLDYNARYFFAVTAYNILGIESAYSSEVSYGKWFPDRVTITWPTNQPAALIVSATLGTHRSQWTVASPIPNAGTITVLIGPGSVFFALSGSTNRLSIYGWNPKNSA